MDNKIIATVAVLALVIGGISLFKAVNVSVSVPPAQIQLGNSSGPVHQGPEFFNAGFGLGNPPISGSGGGCVTTSTTLGSIAASATSSVQFTVPWYSTSTNLAFFLGVSTSSAGDVQFVNVVGSSTKNRVDAYIKNNSSAAWNVATTTWTLCGVSAFTL